MTDAEYARALLRERAGYLAKGRAARAAEVDDELGRLGLKPSAPETTVDRLTNERAVPPRPRK